jgi:hypothetical protein
MKKILAVAAVLFIMALVPSFVSAGQLNYQEMKFFESGYDLPALEQRIYATRFTQSSSRYIRCEVNFRNPLYNIRDQYVTLTLKYYGPDGVLKGSPNASINVKSEWDSPWIATGWGWKDPGNWSSGTYKVEALLDGIYVSQSSFTIYDDTVNARATAVPNGFVGIPWGASRAEVEKAMAERYYPKDSDSKHDVYIYKGEFAGYKAWLIFRFINNKVYEGEALFLWHEANKYIIDRYFSELEGQLIQKYGNPKWSYRAEGGEPWNPCSDHWTLTGQNTTINLSLHKQYEYKDPNPRSVPSEVTGNVNICYTNKTLKEQEEQRARGQDL